MNNYLYILAIFLVFLVLAKAIYRNDIVKKKESFSVPNYVIFYQDSKSDDDSIIQSRLLESKKYNLKGKPDFILKHKSKEQYIPVELKSGKIRDGLVPHEGDFLQLITYFLLIEEEFGTSPKYGKIVYSDYMFIVKNTNKNKKKLLNVVNEMRTMLVTGKCRKVTASFNKCRYCLCNNTVCEVKK